MTIPDDVRVALEAYRQDRTSARWTVLSQLWIGELQVIDVVQRLDPEFPDALPLPVDGVIDDNAELFAWETLPDPDAVARALETLQGSAGSSVAKTSRFSYAATRELGFVTPSEIFREKRFGLGGVPFGNEFSYVTDDVAYATIEAAWNAGVRYYDTSPWYGLGLAERRLGGFLHKQTRSEYVLSSKVGKLLTASRKNNAKEYFPFTPSPNSLRYDYSSDGVKRSVEDSLQRLGVDALDVVFVHDLSPDNPWLPAPWEELFEVARRGAFPALSKMRDEGVVQAWGLGVNSPEPILRLMDVADANLCLLARQYSLIDHVKALHEVFPKARDCGMKFVVGSSLNAGFISGSSRYNYGKDNYKIPAAVLEKRNQLRRVAANHGVDLRTAALQFSSAPDVAAAVVVGCANPQQVLADYTSLETKIPGEFWSQLKNEGLIESDAPIPSEN